MKFIAFNAKHGDSFLISTKQSRVLIDGGMPDTYGQIDSSIDDEGILTAVVVTHVDYDHIGGILNLITDTDSDLSNCNFYMNHPDLITEYQGEQVGFKHGDSVKNLLESRDKSFIPVSSGQKIIAGDIELLALSPDENDIKELHKNWNASQVIVDGELSYLARQKNNGDIINRSSIVLILSFENKKILLLADSHANSTCDKLKAMSYTKTNPLSIDLIKLSHHGSKHNTNRELLELINCSTYYISTNGDHYNHPCKETIELLAMRAKELKQTFDIYLNYDIEDDIIDKCKFDLKNLNFIHNNIVEFK